MALNYTPLVQMLQHAALKLQYPSITVRTETGRKIKVKLAAKGYLAIVLDGEYVGKIEKNGTLILYQDKELVSTVLSEMVEDPYAFTKAQGLRYGFCCFCARELTDPASVSAGYGPICAENFGLPWGAGDAVQVQQISDKGLDEAFGKTDGTGLDFPNIFNRAPEWPSIRKPAPEPLGEAEQMLKDIDNAGIDLKVEGAREVHNMLVGLYSMGVQDSATIVNTIEDFINQMENLKS